MTPQELQEALSRPFESDQIEWRQGGGGKLLAYIDARLVMNRLDEVCTPFGWQNRYPHANGKTVCEIGIKVDGEWIWKANGAGDTNIEAEKGALSDAFKRAAVQWGVGRYLYELPAAPASATKDQLADIHDQFCNKAGWGTRPGTQVYRALKKTVQHFVTDAAAAQQFKVDNDAEIKLMPAAMQRHLNELLDRIGALS